jgi:transposase
MSGFLDAQILQRHTQGATRDAICRLLHVGPNRVSRVLDFFRDNHHLPPSPQNGRPKKVTDEILDYTDARTLASARLSLSELLSEIHSRFEITISRAAISMIRHDLHFHYQPARHVRLLNPGRVEDRIRFCQEMLQRPHEFLLIHFFDESHFVLGADKQWVWYRRGEENPSSTISTHKFPLSLMIFAVIGIDYKSKLLFSSGTVDAG